MPRKPPSAQEPLPDSLDPIEIALDAERGDASADSPARRLLTRQTDLIEADLRHRALQIGSERVGMALKLLTGAAGFVAAFALGSMAWAAHNAHGLVIEPFSVPPDLAAKGLTGQVAAARLLDKLTTMQAQTNSERAAESYINNWAGDVKVEIPTTGVSISELDKFLRQWLGHETHVGGDIVRLADGRLAVTARFGDTPGKTMIGPEADLDALTQQSAESIFAASQPYRYGVWLGENGRGREGAPYFQGLIAHQPPGAERAWDLNGLAQTLLNGGDFPGALAAAQVAVADDPTSPIGYLILAELFDYAGRMDEARAAYARGLALLRSGPGAITANARAVQILSVGARIATASGDYGTAEADNARLSRLPDYNGQPHYGLYDRVFDLGARHDLGGARRLLASLPTEKTPFATLELNDYDLFAIESLLVADLAGDGLAALAIADPLTPGNVGGEIAWLTTIAPPKALALARTGDLAGARALIATTPADCYPCQIARARIEELAASRPGADAAFAEAVRLGPSLPLAGAAWAKALLNRGDIAGALVQARRAAALGPRYADPFEYWGEALLRQGDARGAEAKFIQANALAPRWGANHLHWGEALMRQGKTAEARAQWLAAGGMDLTAGERAWLNHLMYENR